MLQGARRHNERELAVKKEENKSASSMDEGAEKNVDARESEIE